MSKNPRAKTLQELQAEHRALEEQKKIQHQDTITRMKLVALMSTGPKES